MVKEKYFQDEVFNEEASKIRPDARMIHKAAVEIVKVLEKGVTDLREAIYGVVWLANGKKFLFRGLEDAIERAHGGIVRNYKDVGYQIEFKQMFRDKIFYTTGAYSYRGGQFAIYPEIVGLVSKYQKRYHYRKRFLGSDVNPFSTDFPPSFWTWNHRSELLYSDIDVLPDESTYNQYDITTWRVGHYSERSDAVKTESPTPPANVIILPVAKEESAGKIPVVEEPKLSKHQEEKIARQKKEHDFAILCFNALRYNDNSAAHCLVEAIWYNAGKGQQYIVQTASEKSGSGKEIILALIEQYYGERFLSVSEHGPIIDKVIAGEIKKIMLSPVGKNGSRLIR